MNHLDEGTIHAWLDGGGALDATQSREIEAHVAGCASCSAAVAEARGLIAGASRILSALDDVPAGVIPGGAPAAPQGVHRSDVTPIGSRRDVKRGWRVTSWASGIAAVLVAAVVLSTSMKVQPTRDMTQLGVSAPEEVQLDSSAVSMAPMAIDTAASSVSVAERRESAPAAPPASVPRPVRDDAMRKGGAGSASGARESAANRASDAPAAVAQRAAAADVAPTAGQVRGVAVGGQRDTTRLRSTASVQQDSTRLRTTSTQRLALESVVVTGLDATVTAEVERLAGCYRIAMAPAESPVPARTAVAAETQRRTRAAAPSAAAPTAGAQMEFSGRGVASLIRLDTTRSASGFNISRVPSDSAIGSWRVVGDSVRLDLGARGSMTLSPLQRVPCP